MLQQMSLRQIRSRIASIDNIKKVTHAMEMVAVAKLRTAEELVSSMGGYLSGLESIVANVVAGGEGMDHPLLVKRKEIKKTLLCVVTSNTGLCGVYNTSVIHAAEKFLNSRSQDHIDIVAVGRKGLTFFKKKGKSIQSSYLEPASMYPRETFRTLSENMINLYLSGTVDEVYVVYTQFESASKCRPVVEKFLGIDHLKGKNTGYIFDGDSETITEDLLSAYLVAKMKLVLLNAYASEESMRTMAMEEATVNAKELLEGLILLRNKVRQANITKEVLEISSSAEVLG